jgi:hypothetical protein
MWTLDNMEPVIKVDPLANVGPVDNVDPVNISTVFLCTFSRTV